MGRRPEDAPRRGLCMLAGRFPLNARPAKGIAGWYEDPWFSPANIRVGHEVRCGQHWTAVLCRRLFRARGLAITSRLAGHALWLPNNVEEPKAVHNGVEHG